MKSERGLTLVELLVVIVLIGLIAVVVGKSIFSKSDAAKAELNVMKMEQLKQTLSTYRLKFNSYPQKLEDLVSANSEVKRSGKIFIALAEEQDLVDIWNNPYLYKLENDGRTYSLTSLGSDSVDGGDGAKQDVTVRP